MQHLDEGTIHAWLDGALDAEEAARVEQHAAECARCAAAVAEARGLVAGASRLLSALDHTPADVRPRSLGGGSATRRPVSLWHTLRLTPARAAAAAVIVLAAGTALVVRNQPNEMRGQRVVFASDTSKRPRPALPVPAPVDTFPTGQASASAERANAAPAPRVAHAAAVAPSKPNASPAGVADGSSGAEAKKTRRELATLFADTASVKGVDSTRKAAVASAPRDSTTQATSVATVAVAPGASRGEARSLRAAASAPAPAARADRATIGSMSFAGCYAVTADSIAGLPQRLSLDTNRVEMSKLLQRAPTANAAMPESYTVSGDASATRGSFAGARWQRLLDGRIRLSIASPLRSVDLTPTSNSTLVGSMAVDGRLLAVTLQRVDCGR